MKTPDTSQWQKLSPYLDAALEMTNQELTLWLSSLRLQDPSGAEQLEVLLQEHRLLVEENFLENGTVPLPEVKGLAGQAIGPYTLRSQVGQGGMGSVWLAERNDGRYDRQVAIKLLNIALIGKGGEERFKREGKILGRLVHPHIAELIDAGVSRAGQPYLVLEHIEGDHIDTYCDQHQLVIEARIRLFLDVLDAVAQAHANLIVHRDLKPSNVLVRNDGQVKLLDFGIAKLLEGEGHAAEATQLTVGEGHALTPEYAAPEQLKGEAVTTATDVYASGVLLYILLTGQHPAGTGLRTHADLVKAIVDTEPARPSYSVASTQTSSNIATANAAQRATTPDKLSRLLRGDLDTIVAKALKKVPSERYPSVAALADDLRRYLQNEPIGARPDTFIYRTTKFVRRNRMAVALATLALITTAAGVGGTLVQSRRARMQRDFAFRQVERAEALNEFHEFVLSDAAPSGKLFSVNDLLRRAEHIVERQHAADDPDRVDLMVSIGRQYLNQDEISSGRHILEEAYKLSLALPDASVRARAACTFAVSLALGEEVSRAQTLFEEGLREVPEGPGFALDRVECLRSGSEVAQQSGDIAQGIALAEAAQRVLRQSPFDSDVLELDRWTDLANEYSLAGRDREALYAFERAGALLSALGRDETGSAVTVFEDWAIELDQLGRPLEAEKLYRRAIDISRAGQSEEAVSPMVLNNYAKTLRQLGQLKQAEDYAERAYSKAQRVGHQLVVNQSLLERARIYTAENDPSRAAEMLAEVEPRLRQSLPAGHYAFAALALEQGNIALARRNVQAALKLVDQAVNIEEAAVKAGGAGAFYLPIFLTRRSSIELDLRHLDQAAADALLAISLLQKTAPPGSFSAYVGHAQLAWARALQAQGKPDEARAAFHSAAENLQNTLGIEHPDARSARQLAESEIQRP